ncbi:MULTISPECIES: hypothetical protein [unclassified Pseudomonas]|uniref:hypothetical protein n=1 Tax=unclassified Pseudomonas TaxID=196821 RepID=UPI0030D78790
MPVPLIDSSLRLYQETPQNTFDSTREKIDKHCLNKYVICFSEPTGTHPAQLSANIQDIVEAAVKKHGINNVLIVSPQTKNQTNHIVSLANTMGVATLTIGYEKSILPQKTEIGKFYITLDPKQTLKDLDSNLKHAAGRGEFINIDTMEERPLNRATTLPDALPHARPLESYKNNLQSSSQWPPLKQQIHDIGDRKNFLFKRGLLDFGEGIIKVSLQQNVDKNQVSGISDAQLHQLNKIHSTPLDFPPSHLHVPLQTNPAISVVPVDLPSVDAAHTIDIESYISNRVSSGLIDSCKHNRCDFFCAGNEQDLLSYYRGLGFNKAFSISSNTSTKNYLMLHPETGESRIVMSNMTSVARVRHQLLQLHFAGVDVNKIKMLGSVYDLKSESTIRLKEKLLELPDSDTKILYIGNRRKVTEFVARHINKLEPSLTEREAYQELQPSTYTVDSFVFDVTSINHEGKELQIAALRMPNGDLSEDAIEAFLSAGYTHFVMCGAGGSISTTANIGDYVLLNRSHYNNQTLQLPKNMMAQAPRDYFVTCEAASNTTVDSPLVETTDWLENNTKENIGTVDVETAHIFKALLQHQSPLSVTAGMFISDIVGTHPLDEKISADFAYRNLGKFVAQTLDNAIRHEK